MNNTKARVDAAYKSGMLTNAERNRVNEQVRLGNMDNVVAMLLLVAQDYCGKLLEVREGLAALRLSTWD